MSLRRLTHRSAVSCATAVLALSTPGCGPEAPAGAGSALPPNWTEPTTRMELVLIPAGSYRMGLRANEPADLRPAPLHDVRITRPFYLGRHEVTQREWGALMDSGPSQFAGCGEACPVESVSWHDVRDFLARLAAANPGESFRLPTEAEWEYACRAGSDGWFGASSELSPTTANYDGRIAFEGNLDDTFPGAPRPVGSYPPNAWGLTDMAGNVWEWTDDEYCPYATGAVTDPRGRCGTDTIPIRGGSWAFSANAARCGRRYTHARKDSGYSLGFRVVREVPAASRDRNFNRTEGRKTR